MCSVSKISRHVLVVGIVVAEPEGAIGSAFRFHNYPVSTSSIVFVKICAARDIVQWEIEAQGPFEHCSFPTCICCAVIPACWVMSYVAVMPPMVQIYVLGERAFGNNARPFKSAVPAMLVRCCTTSVPALVPGSWHALRVYCWRAIKLVHPGFTRLLILFVLDFSKGELILRAKGLF